MRRMITAAVFVLATILSPTAWGITFGEWATSHGYSSGAVMPDTVNAFNAGIDSLSGISDYDWTTTPTVRLILEENQLSSIETGDFSGLTALETLLVGYNLQLSTIEPNTFVALTNLRQLDLYGDKLSSLDRDMFNGLANLEGLGLGNNPLANIEADTFSGLTNLRYLDLQYNKLSNITTTTFSGLSNLTNLELEGNLITSVEAGSFNHMTNLEGLGLGYNQLPTIEAGTFIGLTSLKLLSLWRNQLTSIDADTFEGLTDLELLGLGENQLTHIETGTFSGLPNLRELYLTANPMIELNLAEADLSSLITLNVQNSLNVSHVSLKQSLLNQTSLSAVMNTFSGIGGLDGVTSLDLSGVDFVNITDLAPLYVLDDLTELWLVNTANLDPVDLDVLLNNLATIQGTAVEGLLYMTAANFAYFNTAGHGLLAAWDAEPGHRVVLVIPEPATWALVAMALVRLSTRCLYIKSWPARAQAPILAKEAQP